MARGTPIPKGFKPMLAATYVEGKTELKFPMLFSPKLDGFRAVVWNGVVYSKNMKPIRNPHVQKLFGHKALDGFDGELVVGSPVGEGVFNRTSSGVTKKTGEPDVTFFVFEALGSNPQESFAERHARARMIVSEAGRDDVVLVPHVLAKTKAEAAKLEEKWLKQRFEGAMGRSPDGPYKFGRSTEKEGFLWKIKRFRDGEALVSHFEEAERNTNEATKDELGRTKRSSAKAGKVAKDTLGMIVAHDLVTQEPMRIGPGRLTDKQRKQLWDERSEHEGKLVVKYRVFDYGAKDAARFPTCQGIKDASDVSQE